MTPNMGAGGNSAMESAAALSNALNKLVETTGRQKPSLESIKGVLSEYHKIRKYRADFVVDAANDLSRVEARCWLIKIFSSAVTLCGEDFYS